MSDRVDLKIAASGCALVCALFASACPNIDNKSSTGTLVVPFELGNDRSCGDLMIKTVRADLEDGMFTEDAPCTNGQVRFKDIPAGSYRIRVYGIDDDGVQVMDSLNGPDLYVNVTGGGKTVIADPAVTLTAAPAHLLLRWNFGFGTCKGLGVQSFAYKAWRSSGDDLLLGGSIDCSTDGEGDEQYRSVPDPKRALSGDEVGEVSVQPVDDTGVNVGDAVIFKFSPPGPGQDIKLSLTCTDSACTGAEKPD